MPPNNNTQYSINELDTAYVKDRAETVVCAADLLESCLASVITH